jgi:hypothetical protein
MQTEYLNMVDNHDQIIGHSLRNTIHQTGLRHRAMHILVFIDSDWLFLQKRFMKKALHKGLWDTSGEILVRVAEDDEQLTRTFRDIWRYYQAMQNE